MADQRTRSEHLAWCKERALACLDTGTGLEAAMSMISDLGKHPETVASQEVGGMLLFITDLEDTESVRKFIVGFN